MGRFQHPDDRPLKVFAVCVVLAILGLWLMTQHHDKRITALEKNILLLRASHVTPEKAQ